MGLRVSTFSCLVNSLSRMMNATMSKVLIALVPASILFIGSLLLFVREKILSSFLQLVGAGCLVVVVLARLCEALQLFPWIPTDYLTRPYINHRVSRGRCQFSCAQAGCTRHSGDQSRRNSQFPLHLRLP